MNFEQPLRTDNGVKNRWNSTVKKKASELRDYCTLWSLQNASPGAEVQLTPINQPKEEVISAEEYSLTDDCVDEALRSSEVNQHDESTFELFDIGFTEFPSSTA